MFKDFHNRGISAILLIVNELKQIEEFRKVLADYHLSDAAKNTLVQAEMVLLTGPTSSGKNTLIGELLQSGRYRFVVSDTTRKPRVNDGVLEKDGVEYWFRAEEDMLADLQAGQFLEAAIIHNQQVSGTSVREVAKATAEAKMALLEIEVQGVDQIQVAKPDGHFFFIIAPNFKDWIARIQGRGELPHDEVNRRLQSAVMEINRALDRDFYYFVINDKAAETARQIHELVTQNVRESDDNEARAAARQLLTDTKAFLASNT